jgi:GTPase SAR1 family protein
MNQDVLVNHLRTLYSIAPPVWKLFPSNDDSKAPSLEMKLSDDMTPDQHLDTALEKLARPFRFAAVGAFSTGKSTLLNALIHHKEFSEKLKEMLGFDSLVDGKKILSTGQQVTTGNITELEFSGEAFKDLNEDHFQFSVTYLSQREVKELVNYLCEQCLEREVVQNINIKGSYLEWVQSVVGLLKNIESKYNDPRIDSTLKNNLIQFAELIKTLNSKIGNDYVQPISYSRILKKGRLGLDEFQKLQTRPQLQALDPFTRVNFYTGEFHLIKSLRFKFPHPDFEGFNFSIFDFPGLGSGNRRDDFISSKFIPESNIILMPFLSTAVGGAAVNHILDVFSKTRTNMGPEDLLKRIYFINSNFPVVSPKLKTDQPQSKADQLLFFKNFFQPVQNQMHRIIVTEQNEVKQKELYKKYLSHFIGCDGLLGGIIRDGYHDNNEANSNSVLKNHRQCELDGNFDVPDSSDLAHLVNDASLNAACPVLPSMLGDSSIVASIQEIFKSFKGDGGVKNLIKVIKDLQKSGIGKSIVEGDIENHLKAAAHPFSGLNNTLKIQIQNQGENISITDLIENFQKGAEVSANCGKMFDYWTKIGLSDQVQNNNKSFLDGLEKLKGFEKSFYSDLKNKINQLATVQEFNNFKSKLRTVPSSDEIKSWIIGGGVLTEKKFFGKAKSGEGLISSNHSLVMYHFYVEVRKKIFVFMEEKLQPIFHKSIVSFLLENFKTWEPVSLVFCKIDNLLTSNRQSLQGDVEDFVQKKDDSEIFEFIKDVRKLEEHLLFEKINYIDRYNLELNHIDVVEGVFPATARQLSIFLSRIGVNGFKSSSELVDLNFADEKTALPKILCGLGFSENHFTNNFAKPEDDYWTCQLPRFIGKFIDNENKKIIWNPVPFDLLAGDVNSVNLIPEICSYLWNLFEPFAVKFIKSETKDFKSFITQFLTSTHELYKDSDNQNKTFWDWIQENNAEICDKTADEAVKAQVRDILKTLSQANIFSN